MFTSNLALYKCFLLTYLLVHASVMSELDAYNSNIVHAYVMSELDAYNSTLAGITSSVEKNPGFISIAQPSGKTRVFPGFTGQYRVILDLMGLLHKKTDFN